MAKSLPNIIYTEDNHNHPVIDSDSSYYTIPYYKDTTFFDNYDSYVNFVKACERAVRGNDRYKKYIHYLKTEIKLDHCQVLKDVNDSDADIELHHGPVFTLFDICAIVLEYFILKKWKVSTSRIADAVLTEHQENRINCVMVSKTVHEEIHNGDIFISLHQTYGDVAKFNKKYKDAMNDIYKEQVNRYVDRSLIYDSNDFGVLELNKELWEKK